MTADLGQRSPNEGSSPPSEKFAHCLPVNWTDRMFAKLMFAIAVPKNDNQRSKTRERLPPRCSR
jgi:hypothetical protein